MLEEAVTKEISMRTPYRIVGDREQADSILERHRSPSTTRT